MARISQALLDRLEQKLGVTKQQVYARIASTARRTLLDRHLAALVFASEQHINIHKYSTPEQRAEIRGVLNNPTPSPASVPAEKPIAPLQRRERKGRTRRRGDNSVFVVYGRNESLRKSMFDFLRALGLQPLEWSKAVLKARGANPYVGNILDAAMGDVSAVVVLLSPDDEAKLKDQFCKQGEKGTEGKLQGQPRANVLFEAGLALGRHPEKTLLVQVGKIRKISDIDGLHIVRLGNDHQSRNDVANRLRVIVSSVDTTGSDWTTVGNFVP